MDEKVIPERDRMGLAQALIYLYKLRNVIPDESGLAQALDAVFQYIDEMSLLVEIVEAEKELLS